MKKTFISFLFVVLGALGYNAASPMLGGYGVNRINITGSSSTPTFLATSTDPIVTDITLEDDTKKVQVLFRNKASSTDAALKFEIAWSYDGTTYFGDAFLNTTTTEQAILSNATSSIVYQPPDTQANFRAFTIEDVIAKFLRVYIKRGGNGAAQSANGEIWAEAQYK